MVLFFSSIWNFSVYKIIDNDFPGGSDDKESACNAWGMCLIPRSGRSPGEGISKLKWTGMGEFNSDDQYIYYCGQESLRRNGVAIMVNKRVRNAVLGCNLKNDRMISVHFQGKPFNIVVIQVYAPTSNAEEAEVEQYYEDLKTF